MAKHLVLVVLSRGWLRPLLGFESLVDKFLEAYEGSQLFPAFLESTEEFSRRLPNSSLPSWNPLTNSVALEVGGSVMETSRQR